MFWRMIAWLLSIDWVASLIIRQAQKTPYSDIQSMGGDMVYMGRWWLWNPYLPRQI